MSFAFPSEALMQASPPYLATQSTADALCIAAPLLQSELSCNAVLDLFTRNTETPAFAVQLPQGFGLVDRTSFLSTFALPFRRDLYARNPVRDFSDLQPRVVPASVRDGLTAG